MHNSVEIYLQLKSSQSSLTRKQHQYYYHNMYT